MPAALAPAVARLRQDGTLVPTIGSQTATTHILVSTPEQLANSVSTGTISLQQILMVAVDEVDAVLCGEPFDKTLPDTAEQLLQRLGAAPAPAVRGAPVSTSTSTSIPASTSTAVPAASADVQFVMATAHLHDAHALALSRRFPSLSFVRQQTAKHNSVLVPTLRQEFHYFSGGQGAREEKLLALLREVCACIV
jgi:superfamily II DNA/RNA helicase